MAVRGTPMGCLWGARVVSLWRPWTVRGVAVGLTWCVRGDTDGLLVRRSWGVHALCVGHLWRSVRGVPTVCLQAVRNESVECT